MNKTIYLIPSIIAPEGLDQIPQATREIAFRLNRFIVEHERTARRYLIKLGYPGNIDQIQWLEWNKKSNPEEWLEVMGWLSGEEDIGIISDAGCPGIADPGSDVVYYAHSQGYRIMPLSGPSSIFLALMASGMNGQSFSFHGYLPIDKQDRMKKIRSLEKASSSGGGAQIFMETPYRNKQMLDQWVRAGQAETELCIACNLTANDGWVRTMKLKDWKNHVKTIDIHKKPCIFIVQYK